MHDYAPVVLFVYKRQDLTVQVIESLKRNNLAAMSRLFIFSDAAKTKADEDGVAKVRNYIASVDGFAQVTVISAQHNKGCAPSIIEGVSKVIEQYGKAIIVEDDLTLTPNFLDYMNSALDYYADKNVFSICGFGLALRFDPSDQSDVCYLPRTGSWGWATWKNRWDKADWGMADYAAFKKDRAAQKKFNIGGPDMSRMLDHQMQGKIDAWDIRWCYARFKTGMLTVYPKITKVNNSGFGQDATHNATNPNFKVIMDETNKTSFDFSGPIAVNQAVLKQFTRYFSRPYRIRAKLRNYMARLVS